MLELNNKDKISDPKELISSVLCKRRRNSRWPNFNKKSQVKNFPNISQTVNILRNSQSVNDFNSSNFKKNNIDVLVFLEENIFTKLVDGLREIISGMNSSVEKNRFFDKVLKRMRKHSEIKDFGRFSRLVLAWAN